MYNSTLSENRIRPTLSLFFVAEKARVAAISVMYSLLKTEFDPKKFDPEISIINIIVNSLSSSKTFMNVSLYLAVTFQSIALTSSPN